MPGLDGRVPHPRSGWGVPQGTPPARTGWGTPPPGLDGIPHWPGLDGVPPPPIRHSSMASTCYAAGGMPFAFTQEAFLVLIHFRMKEQLIITYNI